MHQRILILDYGSQVTQLIARRIREVGVYCEIHPGDIDNAFIEAFNGRLRAECLNAHWFLSLADANEKLEAWRRDYNEVRPHSAIGNKPPISLMLASAAHGPP